MITCYFITRPQLLTHRTSFAAGTLSYAPNTGLFVGDGTGGGWYSLCSPSAESVCVCVCVCVCAVCVNPTDVNRSSLISYFTRDVSAIGREKSRVGSKSRDMEKRDVYSIAYRPIISSFRISALERSVARDSKKSSIISDPRFSIRNGRDRRLDVPNRSIPADPSCRSGSRFSAMNFTYLLFRTLLSALPDDVASNFIRDDRGCEFPPLQFASHRRRRERCVQPTNESAPRTRSTSVDERPRSNTRCKHGKQEILNGETEQKRIGNGQSLHCVRVLGRWKRDEASWSMINRRHRCRDQRSSVLRCSVSRWPMR